MERTSQQVKYQALRNGVIELLDMCSSLEDIAALGAFETINTIHDLLPLDYNKAPKVFSNKEIEAISEFIQLVEIASDATENDTWTLTGSKPRKSGYGFLYSPKRHWLSSRSGDAFLRRAKNRSLLSHRPIHPQHPAVFSAAAPPVARKTPARILANGSAVIDITTCAREEFPIAIAFYQQ